MIAVPTRTIRWRLPALVLIAIAIVAVWGLLRQGDAVEVLTAPVMYQDLSQQVTTNGSVTPTSEFQARAFWPRIIDQVYVELGDKVSGRRGWRPGAKARTWAPTHAQYPVR